MAEATLAREKSWNLDTWADDVSKLCDALGLEHPVVFGTSFGGFVALNYAKRHPGHPGKLILSSTAARINPSRMFEMFERLGGPRVRAVAERFLEDPTPENKEAYDRMCLPHYTQRQVDADSGPRIERRHDVLENFTREGALRFDRRQGLDRIACPAPVMAGELDPAVPIDDARDLAEALPAGSTRFEPFAGAGHMLPSENPEAVMRVVKEFVLDNTL
jgi:proline iminopeptidase